jgi:hypothetical protein
MEAGYLVPILLFEFITIQREIEELKPDEVRNQEVYYE